MPDVTACYGMPFDFIAFFGYFHTVLLTINGEYVKKPNEKKSSIVGRMPKGRIVRKAE